MTTHSHGTGLSQRHKSHGYILIIAFGCHVEDLRVDLLTVEG